MIAEGERSEALGAVGPPRPSRVSGEGAARKLFQQLIRIAMRSKYTPDDFHNAKMGDTPGPDFEWFAADRENYIAGFTNAGFAPIPPTVFQSFALYDRTLDIIESLPIVGNAEWRGFKPPRFETWEGWALRGLFTFDWDHGYGHPDDSLPYRWKCIPTTPIHISALPEDIGQYISKTRFENFLFSEVREILLNQ